MTRRVLASAAVLAAALPAAWLAARARLEAAPSGPPPAVTCGARTIAGARYRVCEVPAASIGRLRLLARDGSSQPWGTIDRLNAALRSRGERLLFATNSGIYESASEATGLLVADGGHLYSRLNRRPGPPPSCATNFYCAPNAVFFVAAGRAAVLSTADYAARGATAPALATQSGPMLVQRGRITASVARFVSSRKIRSGVGVRADGTTVFAISDDPVSFRDFAAAFRDQLGTPDALFLDGTISRLYDGGPRMPSQTTDFAAIFVVTAPSAAARP